MFAFLALAGDFGATVSPAMVGSLAELAGGDLKSGLLAATAFPAVLTLGLLILKRKVHGSRIANDTCIRNADPTQRGPSVTRKMHPMCLSQSSVWHGNFPMN